MSDSRLELLTARGAGALAVMRLEGDGAEAAFLQAFRTRAGRRLETIEQGRARVGTIVDLAGAAVDEVVATADAGGIEISGHGGAGAIAAIQSAFRERGVAIAEPGPIPADSPLGARTWLAFRVLSWREQGLLDASWDRAVLALASPRTVCIAGPPNAGKSALFNALLDRERAIVSAEAGTTRDVLREECAVLGVPIVLCDTAGIRDDSCGVEAAGIARARRAAADSDVVLAVVDGSETLSAEARAFLDGLDGSRSIILANKSDAGTVTAMRGAIAVSARTGAGLDALASSLATHILARDPRCIAPPRRS